MISNKMNLSRWLRKSIVGISALALMALLSLSSRSFAADFDWIKLYPEHIGIFTTVGVQQFVAFGYKTDGTRVNITKKVDWISSNENIIKIDKDGLATIVTGITSGQVKVTCSYPKTGNVAPGVNLLLLKKNSYSVTPSAGANGTISPSVAQAVDEGGTVAFTVTPDTGYTASVGGTCGGTLVGTTYTTNAVTADCTVDATFTAITHTVTPTAGANGTITPDTAQTVNEGATTTFTVTPDAGYTASVDGTCGGTLVGDTYTTNAITSDCTVNATFAVTTYTVTPTAGANGTITPDTAQTVNEGATTTFTVTPDANYIIDSVIGTCGGTLAGDTYTTNAITVDCTVDATFIFSP